MKLLTLILLFGCATSNAPSWVQNLRSGEQSLQIKNGSKILYRRMGQSCDQAVAYARSDIRAAYPQFHQVVHQVEVVYYDQHYNDCAVTLSVPLPVKGEVLPSFEKMERSKPYIAYDYRSACWRHFYEAGHSSHNSTQVCWRRGQVIGWCNDDGCFSR